MQRSGERIIKILSKQDLGSQLQKKDLNLDNLIQGNDTNNPYHLRPLLDGLENKEGERAIAQKLSTKLEQFQAGMGAEAALETFKLLEKVLRKNEDEKEAQLKKAKEKVAEWNHAQYVRLAQQLLYTAAFGVSMGVLIPKAPTQVMSATENFAMAGANAIPLYMDSFWPFKRNTPIVVPKVDAEKIIPFIKNNV